MSEEPFSPPPLREDTRAVLVSADTTSSATSITSSQQSSAENQKRNGKRKAHGRSEVWKEFTKIDKNGETRVKCNHCSSSYKFVNSSTTNM